MNKNSFLHSVSVKTKPCTYSSPSELGKSNKLEEELKKRGLNIRLGQKLKGGVASQVYAAKLNSASVIVKHTENIIPFDPTEFMINKKGHNIDTNILIKLSKSKNINVPRVLYYYPDITTTVLEDVRTKGFMLLHNLIVENKLNILSAKNIGVSLAHLSSETQKWSVFSTNESAEQSIYERGLELRLAYPNSQEEYLYLEKEYTKINKYWIWPDGHPKNVFVNEKGECLFIDFGRSHWADQRYMLPNFLAHIVLYSLGGFIPGELATNYLKECIRAYSEIEKVDEQIFCQYLGMEVLHRSFGKWIAGISTKDQKLKLVNFGLSVFDDKINTIDKLLKHFKS